MKLWSLTLFSNHRLSASGCFTITGREMKQVETYAGSNGRNEYTIDLGELKPGEYILEVSNPGFKESVKLIKK